MIADKKLIAHSNGSYGPKAANVMHKSDKLVSTCLSFMQRHNFPSIVGLYTVIWNVKGYMVTTECNCMSHVIILGILPLHYLE